MSADHKPVAATSAEVRYVEIQVGSDTYIFIETDEPAAAQPESPPHDR